MHFSHYLLLAALLIMAVMIAGWLIAVMLSSNDDYYDQVSKAKNDELIRESKWAEFNARR
jgi:hypothetical protein